MLDLEAIEAEFSEAFHHLDKGPQVYEAVARRVPELIAEVRRLEVEVATQQRYAREWESRCYQSIVATQEAERQRWFDAISTVAQGCTFEEMAVCVRIQQQARVSEDPMDGTRATDAMGNRL